MKEKLNITQLSNLYKDNHYSIKLVSLVLLIVLLLNPFLSSISSIATNESFLESIDTLVDDKDKTLTENESNEDKDSSISDNSYNSDEDESTDTNINIENNNDENNLLENTENLDPNSSSDDIRTNLIDNNNMVDSDNTSLPEDKSTLKPETISSNSSKKESVIIKKNITQLNKVLLRTNTLSPSTKTITITKIWQNDNETIRPDSIKVYINKTTTTLLSGTALNAKMKTIARNGTNTSYTYSNTNVEKILQATSEMYEAKRSSLTSSNEIQNSGETNKVYMWYDSTEKALLYYSEADNIFLNSDSNNAFSYFKSLKDISGLSNFNTSYVTNMYQMFYTCSELQDISPLSNWNVINVENMQAMFSAKYNNDGNAYLMKISDITPLSGWNVSNVTNMANMFEYNRDRYRTIAFDSIAPLANWDVRCVKNMNHMFNHTNVRDGATISGWDVGSVSKGNFSMMFENSPSNTTTPQSLPDFSTIRPGNWSNGTYRATYDATVVVPTHPFTSQNADQLESQDSGWNKNGNIWTYEFTVNNDKSIYTTWEDEVTDYESSAYISNPIYVENNGATITNTNINRRLIEITKIWNDTNTALRPNNIKVHLKKDGTNNEEVSNDNNWTKNNNVWTYTFEVFDNANYSVWEENVDYYLSDTPQSSPKLVVNNAATITNTIYPKYDITLTKKVTGDLSKLDEEFEFEITIYDNNNNVLSDNITIENSGQQMQISNGSKIRLKHNDQVVIKDIFQEYKYTIIETNTDYTEYYKIEKTDETDENAKTIVSQTIGRTITRQILNENQTVTYTNNKESSPPTMVNTYTEPYILMVFLLLILVLSFRKINMFF